ncbi:MAG: hypothetical protein ACBZ72_02805 [Candidatus Bathyarchaeia archaeon]|jgi:saccharopine dehydrogenase-like NADP-dependent oxidoreductase
MELVLASLCYFGDRYAELFRAKDGRYYVQIFNLNTCENVTEWLMGDDYLEWIKCLKRNILKWRKQMKKDRLKLSGIF